jgi:hypothetical protein
MTTRKAIIIGSPGGYRNLKFLPGVSIDLENYNNYLQSKPGGQWDVNEIKILLDPTSEDVNKEITTAKQDYIFINFSGHGFTDIASEAQYICLKDKDVPVGKLVSSATKQTIVIDSCREYSTHLAENLRLELILEAKLFVDKKDTRTIFDSAIIKSPEGIILVNSASLNQSAGDDEYKGGHFTYSFIKGGRDFGKNQNTQSVLELDKAVILAENIMHRVFITNQTPVMSGQIRRLTFPPFAVC